MEEFKSLPAAPTCVQDAVGAKPMPTLTALQAPVRAASQERERERVVVSTDRGLAFRRESAWPESNLEQRERRREERRWG